MRHDISMLLRLAGFDADRIPPGADTQLVWTNVPQSWKVFLLLVVAAAVAYGVVHMYRREITTCPRWCKRFLTGLRLSALLLLLVIFLGPAVAPIQHRTSFPNVALVRDASQSMNTADRYLEDRSANAVAAATTKTVSAVRLERPSRAEIMSTVFEQDDRKFLTELERLGKLRVVDFSTDLVDVETRPVRRDSPGNESLAETKPLPPLKAIGRGTDLYGAISHAIADERTSAAVFWTDGQHTSKEHGPDELLSIASKAADQGVPLLFVGVGDPSLPRNLQISEVYADPQVWRGDPFEIQAVLQADGVDGQTVTVSLTERRLSEDGTLADAETVLERREVTLGLGGGQQRLIFAHTPQIEGHFSYNVRVSPIENELSEQDNEPESPATVKVLGEQARVLLVAGSPTWEFRGLQRLLTREKSIDVSSWLQTMDVTRTQDGNTVIDRLPIQREDLFAYDAMILIDPNPIEFDQAWLDLLKQFIGDHAGGFLYLAGPKFSGRFLATEKTSQLRDILPVRFGDVRAMEVETLLSNNARTWRLGITVANIDQPIMRFYPEPNRSLDRWKSLPGIYWSFPAQQAKPASRVLIEHTDPTLRNVEGSRPLLVTGQYGSGRSVYIGFNGTWRWRQVGTNSEYYKRFWIQMVRYLVEGRTLEGRRRGIVETDGFRYQLGDRINLTARLKDASYQPLLLKEVGASVRVGSTPPTAVALKPIPNQPGHYQATLTPRSTGHHLVQVSMEAGGPNPPRVETSFSVSMPAVETNQVWLNKPLLSKLGEASGGGYFDVHQFEEVIAAIPDTSRTVDVRGTPVPLWDTGRMLALLVGMLCVEWTIRKRFKLM